MKRINFHALAFVLLTITLPACKKDKTDLLGAYDSVLYGLYHNPVGEDPYLEVDLVDSSPEINIEFQPTVTQENGRILFNYAGVTFRQDKKVYVIDEVVTQRKSGENTWIIDDENFLSWTFSKSLDIVLVLDVSSSLGANISNIKSNASQVITNILNQNPDARVAVIKFSRGSVATQFSSNSTTLSQFIEQNTIFSSPDIGDYELEGRAETALYETIHQAIQLLNNSDARGKGILTFTDGVSNFQFDPAFQTSGAIIAELTSSGIASYTIGFEGNQGSVDRNILQNLAVNGDFSFPRNLSELNAIFIRFSNSVAAVYDLIYDTNNAKLDQAIEYRFLFNRTLVTEK
jgi:Mg-chelatase subunit ChlD